MDVENTLVRDYMRLSPVFVYENDTLFNALEALKKFNVDTISVIREDFSIVGCIDKVKIKEILIDDFDNNVKRLKQSFIKDFISKNDPPILLYPRMTLTDAYSTMKCFSVKGLPVADVPWEKKIIGFLWLEDILPIVNESYLKVSV